jgi:hypothetical protein
MQQQVLRAMPRLQLIVLENVLKFAKECVGPLTLGIGSDQLSIKDQKNLRATPRLLRDLRPDSYRDGFGIWISRIRADTRPPSINHQCLSGDLFCGIRNKEQCCACNIRNMRRPAHGCELRPDIFVVGFVGCCTLR